MTGWVQRLGELAHYRPQGVVWDTEIWPMMARAEVAKGTRWLQDKLWDLKFASWIIHIDTKPDTCRACGAKIEGAHELSRYCSTACRKVAYRRRAANKPTDWEATVATANETLGVVRETMRHANRWWKHQHQRGQPPAIAPPDLTRIDHLPYTPGRCGQGCDATSTCSHTGGICLFTGTGVVRHGDGDETG
jgi:hypothetical protein